MRKTLVALALGAALALNTGCFPPLTQDYAEKQNPIYYDLESLCDTETKTKKDLTLHVYIEPSDILWDYHEYKDEIFGYVKAFFNTQNVDCKVIYHNKPFRKSFLKSNVKAIEILSSENNIAKRYIQIKGLDTKKEIKNAEKDTKDILGIALVEKGIGLIDGAWESWRGKMSRKEVIAQFPECYQGINKKEYKLRQNAGIIVHEAAHCLGLFHPNTFDPAVVPEDTKKIPNAMGYEAPYFSSHIPIGRIFLPVQKKLLHSSLAGNRTYKELKKVNFDFHAYLENIGDENGLITMHKRLISSIGRPIRFYKK